VSQAQLETKQAQNGLGWEKCETKQTRPGLKSNATCSKIIVATIVIVEVEPLKIRSP